MMLSINTLDQFLMAYEAGERNFFNCEFDKYSCSDVNLSGALFKDCFMPFYFKRANCENTQFINCNLKTADFFEANLKNAIIRGCSVEGLSLKMANVENLVFEGNYYMGSVMDQDDVLSFL